MANMDKRLYKNRAALNVLAGSIQNAKEVFEASEGHVLV
ncbi:KDGP aldolase, partial [Peribacillus sp. NPDC056705]